MNQNSIAIDINFIDIDKEVEESVEFALNAPEPNPNDLTKYIWAED